MPMSASLVSDSERSLPAVVGRYRWVVVGGDVTHVCRCYVARDPAQPLRNVITDLNDRRVFIMFLDRMSDPELAATVMVSFEVVAEEVAESAASKRATPGDETPLFAFALDNDEVCPHLLCTRSVLSGAGLPSPKRLCVLTCDWWLWHFPPYVLMSLTHLLLFSLTHSFAITLSLSTPSHTHALSLAPFLTHTPSGPVWYASGRRVCARSAVCSSTVRAPPVYG